MSGADNLAMLGRGIGGLVVVLVLIALLARFARRRATKGEGTGLRVVQRLGLSREANLAVVEVSNRTLLLGVTAQGVTMLASLDSPDEADRPAQADQIDQITQIEEAAPIADAEALPAPSRIPPTQLDLTGLERGIARPRSASPVGTGRPVVPESTAGVPNGVALEDYPDLASALRAAGRTTAGPNTSNSTDAAAQPGAATTTALADAEEPGSGQRVAAPRTRAEARAQGALTSSSGARTRRAKPKPAKPGELKVTRMGAAATATAETTTGKTTTGRVAAGKAAAGKGPAAGRIQASGSVLSPRTWRQGVDALRELTVRRG